jgi:hypothetical protein
VRLVRFLLLATIAALATGCVTQQACSGVQSTDRMICAMNRDPDISRQQIQALADQAVRERTALVGFLGNDVGPIAVIVRDKGNAFHKPPATIHIPSRLIRKSHAITAHEITHLLTQGWASRVLKEGLAVYAQQRFGEQQGWPNYRRSVHAAARHWLSDKRVAIRTLEDAETTFRTAQPGETERKLAAYSLAGSWVSWILDMKLDGDITRFMSQLYRSGDYEGVLKQPAEGLEQEWRAFIDLKW